MLLVLAVHIELPDASNAELLLLELNLVGCRRKFRCKRTDMVGKRSREEKDLDRVVSGKHAMGE
jgi:hypothetical protein